MAAEIPAHFSASDYDPVHQADIATIVNGTESIWVNGTKPTVFYGQKVNMPVTSFPFARLASVSTSDGSVTYLYHQMNGTTFAEEQWDKSVKDWGSTTYINIMPS